MGDWGPYKVGGSRPPIDESAECLLYISTGQIYSSFCWYIIRLHELLPKDNLTISLPQNNRSIFHTSHNSAAKYYFIRVGKQLFLRSYQFPGNFSTVSDHKLIIHGRSSLDVVR